MADQDQSASSSPHKPVRRRRAPKGEMRRAALLDAATDVFAKHGYEASSMRDVADIAGITTVGLLHHYPNKVALLEAMLARRDQRVTQRFADMEMQPTLKGFLAFARMSMGFSVTARKECQAAMMINVESLAEHHPAFAWYQEKFELTHAHARAHLKTLQEAGEVCPDVDVNRVTVELFSMMDGLQIQWLRDPDEVDVMTTFDDYLQRLSTALENK